MGNPARFVVFYFSYLFLIYIGDLNAGTVGGNRIGLCYIWFS